MSSLNVEEEAELKRNAVNEMKIVLINNDFDLRHNDGIGRYAKEVSGSLAKIGLDFKAISTDDLRITQKRSINFINIPIVKKAVKDYLTKHKPDLLHVIKPESFVELPNLSEGVPVVTTWHDMKLFHRNILFRGEKGLLKRSVFERAYEKAYTSSTAIVAVSSMTVKDINEWAMKRGIFDLQKRIDVINPGINENFINSSTWNGERKDFIYVGFLPKVLPQLLTAFSAISARMGKSMLHIFTSTDGAKDIIREASISIRKEWLLNKIVVHYKPSDADVLEMLRKSVALLHLSHMEGFGFPILESLAAGTPAIVLKSARIPPEVLRFAIRLDLEEIPEKCSELETKQHSVSPEATSYARSFTYSRTAENLLKLYASLGRGDYPVRGDRPANI